MAPSNAHLETEHEVQCNKHEDHSSHESIEYLAVYAECLGRPFFWKQFGTEVMEWTIESFYGLGQPGQGQGQKIL